MKKGANKSIHGWKVVLFASLSFFFLTCKNTPVENQEVFHSIATHDLTISAEQYDEFSRLVLFQGTASLSLVTSTGSFDGTIPPGDTSYTFRNVPLQFFALHAEKEGFYPCDAGGTQIFVSFYPLPTPEMRIDSIGVAGEIKDSYFDAVVIKCVGHQMLPPGGTEDCIFLFGRDSTVGLNPDSYFLSQYGIRRGSNAFEYEYSKDQINTSPPSKIYVTARLATGATKLYYDPSTQKNIIINVEDNTRVVTSFVF